MMKVVQTQKASRQKWLKRECFTFYSVRRLILPESEEDEDVEVEELLEVEVEVLECVAVDETGSSLADLTLQPRTAQSVNVMHASSALTACT